jgi:hypothetical protein
MALLKRRAMVINMGIITTIMDMAIRMATVMATVIHQVTVTRMATVTHLVIALVIVQVSSLTTTVE